MAKELPYFKFEPSEYIAGNIQDCSFEAQGVFINICSLYWIRLGDMNYASALQRICKGIPKALEELCEAGILKVEDDKIIISFLDIQLNEFQDTSEKRRNAANKRWNDASALQVQSKSNAIREEKRREKKRREEENGGWVLPFGDEFKKTWNEWVEYRKQKKQKLTLLGAKKQIKLLSDFHEEAAIKMLNQSMFNGWTGIFPLKDQNNGHSKKEHPAEAAARAFAERVGTKSK